MRPDDLRSAIERPAKSAGLSFSPPELVDRILADVGSQEGRLPLLQFALKETWERREGDKLTAEGYTEVGGVAGAIEKTAEAAYERLSQDQKDAARRLFLRLVIPGEGQADTRARSLIPQDPEQRDVIKLFSDPKIRLLVTGVAPLQGAAREGDMRATVEVAHEALIQRWPTHRAWVAQNRENLRARAAILRSMEEWEEKDRNDDYLLPSGVQLERGKALLASPGDVPIDDIRDYVERSVKKEDDRAAAEREAELADQKRIADAERKAKEAAEEAARQATARAAAETGLRAAAEQKALAEQQARKDAEALAGGAPAHDFRRRRGPRPRGGARGLRLRAMAQRGPLHRACDQRRERDGFGPRKIDARPQGHADRSRAGDLEAGAGAAAAADRRERVVSRRRASVMLYKR